MSPLLPIFLIFLLHHTAHSVWPECRDPHDSPSAMRAAHRCLPPLQTHPETYSVCKTSVCYLFLQDAPFVNVPTSFSKLRNNTSLYKPFRCGRPSTLHSELNGVTFSLHNRTDSATDLCIWAGPGDQCTFNALVDFIDLAADDGYSFAITGLLLQMPDRECRHFPSAPILDDAMSVVGRRYEPQDSPNNAWRQLTGPFNLITWLLFLAVLLIQIVICIFIARRFPGYSTHPSGTTFRVFQGDFSSAATQDPRWEPTYVLAARIFRISVVLYVTIFAMLYELAAVNFLFQQRPMEIGQSVRSLSINELKEYSIMQDSALERVWNASVNPDGTKYDGSNELKVPWKRCGSTRECISWLSNNEKQVKFVVTNEVMGQHLLKLENKCDELTVFATDDILYHFSGYWLYNRKCDVQKRKQIDSQLSSLRISGKIRDLIEDYIGIGGHPCMHANENQITPFIGLLPLSLFVVMPLLCAVGVLLRCGGVLQKLLPKHKKREDERGMRESPWWMDEGSFDEGRRRNGVYFMAAVFGRKRMPNGQQIGFIGPSSSLDSSSTITGPSPSLDIDFNNVHFQQVC